MSYILDALKRSEQERQRAELPMQTAVALEPEAPRRPGWGGRIAAGLVLVNLLALGILFWPGPQVPQPSAPTPVAPVAADSRASLAQLAGSDRDRPMLASPSTAPAENRGVAPAVAPARPQRPAAAAAKTPEAPAYAPELAALPEEFRRGVPPIPVNIHVYAEQSAARFVLVDMKLYGEGSQLPSGVRVEQITPTGLILSHQGQRFNLTVR